MKYEPAVSQDTCNIMSSAPGDVKWAATEYTQYNKDWLRETPVCAPPKLSSPPTDEDENEDDEEDDYEHEDADEFEDQDEDEDDDEDEDEDEDEEGEATTTTTTTTTT